MPELSTSLPAGVLFVGSTRYSEPLPDGIQKKFSGLQERVGPIYVIGSSVDGHTRTFEADGVRLVLHRRYNRWRRLFGRLLWSAMQVRRIIVSGSVDTVIAQSPYEGLAALVAMRTTPGGRRVAFVVEAHADFENAAGARFGSVVHLFERGFQRVLRRVVRRADVVRVISEATRDIVSRIAPSVPLLSFPAWTDMDVFLDARADTFEAAPASPVVLYAGVLTPLKNVHTLVEAFSRIADAHPEARLSLVGAIEDSAYAAALQRTVAEKGLAARVEMPGGVPQQELAARMASASVLVLPSKSEGLGRVVFEAMATGTPVIGANVGGIPSMITPGHTGWLFDPADPAALANALDEALSDPERTRAMGDAAHGFAQTFFSTEQYLVDMTRLVEMARERAAARVPGGPARRES